MACCGPCAGIEKEFNRKIASWELARYRRRGAAGTTKALLDLLRRGSVAGATLLDVGGGVGVIQHELATAGVARITSVDAAAAYLEAQKAEAARRGYGDRVTHVHGDFAALGARIPDHDIVTLDRVICCYPDMRSLVDVSAARARRLYGAVFPRGTWWNRVGIRLMNALMWMRRSPFRSYVHPPAEIERLLAAHGLRRTASRTTFIWQVAVYAR